MSYRYIGNKTRFLAVLLDVVPEIVRSGATVADPMCGTAAVSEALRRSGYRVLASDMMTYSFHHACVRLLLSRAPAFRRVGLGGYAAVLAYLNELRPRRGFFHREFSPAGEPSEGQPPRRYLSPSNAERLDGINRQIGAWHRDSKLSALEHSLLRHDLVLAVNRVANIAGTYGHFRSVWSNGSLSSLELQAASFVRERSLPHVVRQGPVETLAGQIEADLCYLDPPYTKRQYAANYHLIETVARGDEPRAVGMSGLRPWRDQYSDFCSKLRVRDSLQAVIQGMKCRRFLISYSADGLLGLDDLTTFLRGFGKTEVWAHPYPRFRSNASGLAPVGTEYLLYLERKRNA